MSYLKDKSEHNFTAADVLYKQSLYAPSVHCSYYGFYQFAMHLLDNKLGISFAVQKANSGTSHQYAIKEVLNAVANNSLQDYTDINRKIKSLRRLRTKADYENKEINQQTSEAARNTARNIRDYLKNNL